MTKKEYDVCVKFMQEKKGRWVLHNCSMCNYPCAFLSDDGYDLYYDSGCNCVRYSAMSRRPTSWESLFEILEKNHLLPSGWDVVEENGAI